jgi:hypothetical protein
LPTSHTLSKESKEVFLKCCSWAEISHCVTKERKHLKVPWLHVKSSSTLGQILQIRLPAAQFFCLSSH